MAKDTTKIKKKSKVEKVAERVIEAIPAIEVEIEKRLTEHREAVKRLKV